MMLYALLWRDIRVLKCCFTFNFVYHFWSVITGTTTVTEVILGSNLSNHSKDPGHPQFWRKKLSVLVFMVFFNVFFFLNTTPNKSLGWEIKWIQKPFFQKICMMTFPTAMCKHTFIVTCFWGILQLSVEWLIKFHQQVWDGSDDVDLKEKCRFAYKFSF